MTEAPAPSYRSALRHRDFRLLVGSFAVDQVGSWAYNIVLLAYVYDQTHSPTYLSLATAVRWVPALISSGYGGVLADRYDRVLVLRASSFLCFLLSAVMVAVIATNGPLPLLLVVSGMLAVAGTPYRPAAGALTVDAVGEKDLAAANALYALVESGAVVLGPALGGLLLVLGRPEVGLAINAGSFLVAFLAVSRIATRSQGGAGQQGESLVRQLTDGFGAVVGEPVARTLVLFVFLDTAVYGASSVLYISLSIRLGSGTEGVSYLLAGQALGGVVLAGVANRASSASGLAPVIVGGMLLLSLPFAVMPWVHEPVMAFVLQVIAGAGMVLIDVLAITALQRDVPRELLSRALGLVDALTLAACLAGSAATAVLLETTGLTDTLLVIGLGFSAVAVLCAGPLRRADRAAVDDLAVLNERVRTFEALDLFAAATRPALALLARDVEEVSLPAGSVLLHQGDPAEALWILVSGSLRADVDGVAVSTVEAPGYVGELGLLHYRPRSATVTVATDSVLWRVGAEEFRAALEQLGTSSSFLGTAKFRLTRTPAPRASQEDHA